jgi:phage protein D
MAFALSNPVRSPYWVLTYQGIDISAAVSRMVVSVAYRDYLSELSGELEIVFEDHARVWQASWYPGLGDRLNLAIGYRGEAMLRCGDFQIDQLELKGPPDTFTVRCLAAFITVSMRTAYSRGYEGQTLLEIAESVAARYDLSLISAPEVIDLTFDRVTQRHETDLTFLKRLALEHGYDFTVRGTQLIFYSRAALEAVAPLTQIARTDVESFQFRNRTHDIYRSAQVAFQNPSDKSLIVEGASAAASIPTADALKLVARCENSQQASLKAQAALSERNRYFVEGMLTMPGSIEMASGSTIQIAEFGEFDGTYIILEAHHELDRARGYVTRVEVSRVL